MRIGLLLACVAVAARGAGPAIRGAAVHEELLYTWGERTVVHELPELNSKAAKTPPLAAATPVDANADRTADLAAVTASGDLIWIDGKNGDSHPLDTGVETAEVVAFTLHNLPGVLLIHKGMEVRFYPLPSGPPRTLYSFYSATLQSGLLLRDLDRDGRTDIVIGNYWMRQPESADQHWRLFAIRTWSEERLSANSVFAMPDDDTLWVAQSGMSNARLARFTRPKTVTDQWAPEPMQGDLALDRPSSLVPWRRGVLVGERGGRGRVIEVGNGAPRVLLETPGVVLLHAIKGGRLLVVTIDGPRVIDP